MAVDEALAARVRDALGDADGLVEKRMFGGLAFLIDGNMAVGVHGEDLIVRLPPEETTTPSASRTSGSSTCPGGR